MKKDIQFAVIWNRESDWTINQLICSALNCSFKKMYLFSDVCVWLIVWLLSWKMSMMKEKTDDFFKGCWWENSWMSVGSHWRTNSPTNSLQRLRHRSEVSVCCQSFREDPVLLSGLWCQQMMSQPRWHHPDWQTTVMSPNSNREERFS